MTDWLTRRKQISHPVTATVSASVALDLLALVEGHDGDPRRFLDDVKLSHLTGILVRSPDREADLSRSDFSILYAQAVARLDSCAARQEGRESITKRGFDMMCYAIITCTTLRQAIARMADFATLTTPRMGTIGLHVTGDVATFEMAVDRRVRNGCSYLSDLTGLSAYHRLFAWLIGETIPLLGTTLRYPPLLPPRTVAYLMPHHVRHDAGENSLRFPAAYLDRPVTRSRHELDRLLERFPFDMEEPQSVDTSLTERVRHIFTVMLADGQPPSVSTDLASRLGISVATLKRRLASEGTSVSRLKAAARRDLALSLLDNPRLSIAEIAQRAGFSDADAFRRAFRQWAGRSPSCWRTKADATRNAASGHGDAGHPDADEGERPPSTSSIGRDIPADLHQTPGANGR